MRKYEKQDEPTEGRVTLEVNTNYVLSITRWPVQTHIQQEKNRKPYGIFSKLPAGDG